MSFPLPPHARVRALPQGGSPTPPSPKGNAVVLYTRPETTPSHFWFKIGQNSSRPRKEKKIRFGLDTCPALIRIGGFRAPIRGLDYVSSEALRGERETTMHARQCYMLPYYTGDHSTHGQDTSPTLLVVWDFFLRLLFGPDCGLR